MDRDRGMPRRLLRDILLNLVAGTAIAIGWVVKDRSDVVFWGCILVAGVILIPQYRRMTAARRRAGMAAAARTRDGQA